MLDGRSSTSLAVANCPAAFITGYRFGLPTTTIAKAAEDPPSGKLRNRRIRRLCRRCERLQTLAARHAEIAKRRNVTACFKHFTLALQRVMATKTPATSPANDPPASAAVPRSRI
ncbi:hypothetical protein WI845_08090 [Vibrio cholerae]